MTEIIPRLFVGSWHDARDNTLGLYRVTVAVDSLFLGEAKYGLVDGPGNDFALFQEAVDCVVDLHKNGKSVLVHCVAGRSRSVAVVVCALAAINGWGMCQSFDYILRLRDEIRIHPSLSKLILERLGET